MENFGTSIYKTVIKNILFQFDPELIHNLTLQTGELLGRFSNIKLDIDPSLRQEIVGVNFDSPVGLAAGFDYEGKLTQILPSLGFGFETIGTITNFPYEGNPKPRLGRLPKSKSLMVYKGFKNEGAKITSNKLSKLELKIPIGISIGKTNTTTIKTQKEAVVDVIEAFKIFEKSKLKASFYELNISCPNLFGDISFYPPKNLNELLVAVDLLRISKPIFIKMPIGKTNREILDMLNVISKHKITGVIFGNVQTNRNHKLLDKTEVSRFKKGNFSGKPTEERSNQLISLCYKNFKNRFVIIGCGGIFNAKDAYKKIKLGASLVQLITGLVYEGPMLVNEINSGLSKLLKNEGFKNINEAIGSE